MEDPAIEKGFGSDNHAGVHLEVLQALVVELMADSQKDQSNDYL